jgi:hypothetical protein
MRGEDPAGVEGVRASGKKGADRRRLDALFNAPGRSGRRYDNGAVKEPKKHRSARSGPDGTRPYGKRFPPSNLLAQRFRKNYGGSD